MLLPKKVIITEKGNKSLPKKVTPVVKERFKEKKQEVVSSNDVRINEFQFFKDLFMSKWNDLAGVEKKIPAIISIAEKSSREKRLKALWGDKNFAGSLDRLFEEIKKSKLLCGRLEKPSPGHENWKITVDWLIANDKNYLKILEGNYRDGKAGETGRDTLRRIAEGEDEGDRGGEVIDVDHRDLP